MTYNLRQHFHSTGAKFVLLLFNGWLLGAAIAQETEAVAAVTVNRNVAEAAKYDLSAVDRIVVYKAARRMELVRAGEVVRNYKIALGLRPLGHKVRAGDSRTPEGHYMLVRRNIKSRFFLSIQVSYPNERDQANARRLEASAGSGIMIHGLPNLPSRLMEYYSRVDWTDGCIAVSNIDMLEVWLMTTLGTPIEIRP